MQGVGHEIGSCVERRGVDAIRGNGGRVVDGIEHSGDLDGREASRWRHEWEVSRRRHGCEKRKEFRGLLDIMRKACQHDAVFRLHKQCTKASFPLCDEQKHLVHFDLIGFS